jgi:lactoylglutathione lyase
MSNVLHTAITVSDLDAMREFYEGTLGLPHSRDFEVDGTLNYFVGGEDAEIQFVHDPDADPDPASDRSGSELDHLAVGVADVDAVVAEAREEWDSDVLTEPTDMADLGVRIAFVTDPEGYVVELIADL